MPRADKNAIVRRAISAWYRKNRRDLQWRFTTDPYEILVSEVMLQQTQVSRVILKHPEFLKQFPTVHALERATRGGVLRAWKGMGYNNRAIRLHEMAQRVVADHSGRFPETAEELTALPGIGRYTAHALLCFAFRKRVPVADVNIIRVLSRIFHRMKSPQEYKPAEEIWELAGRLLPRNAFDWNQALMDLGATICTARSPRCGECPVAQICSSRTAMSRSGFTPASRKKSRPEPSYRGIPRRIWRGRVIESLRQMDHSSPVALEAVGAAIMPGYCTDDEVWMESLVILLEADGLISVRRTNSRTKVALAN